MLYDTHAHLNDKAFALDLEETLLRARDADVTRINVAGCDWETSRQAVAMAERYDEIYAVIGVHPSDSRSYNDALEADLLTWGKSDNVVAIGEIGLDYHYDDTDAKTQDIVFRRQIRMAKILSLPLVIHSRDAMEDTLRILEEECGEKPHKGVFHCFSGSWEQAQVCLKLGYYLGFDGPLTFKNAKKPVRVVEQMPLDRLLIETDCPYLSPEPRRGRRNEPAHVRYVAEKVAELRGISVEEVERITFENGCHLFRRPLSRA
jgi:TatD DNase family protein